MTESTTITAEASNDYGIRGQHSSWSTARSTYTAKDNDSTTMMGVWHSTVSGLYGVERGTPTFDLSSFTDEELTSAVLKMTGDTLRDTGSAFSLYVYAYTQSSITSDSDGFNAYGSTSFGSIASSAYSTSNDGMTITLNASGRSYIEGKYGGDCIFMIRGTRDISNSAPATGTGEWITFANGEYDTKAARPHLYLEYEPLASTWTPKIMMIMKPLADGFLDWIRKPLQQDMYLQI